MFYTTILLNTVNTLMQQPIINDVDITPNFFVTILSGVILALIFQIILTAISVAAGVTSVGNFKKSYAKSKVEMDESDNNNDHNINVGVKYTSMFGIWSLITTSIALFGATALALKINVVESTFSNITTALVIWGLFFLILFYLETKIVGSLLGNLVTAVTSGFKNSANAISSMFETSPYKKVDNILDHTIDKVRSEFDTGISSEKINSVMDNFFTKVDERIPEFDSIKADLEDIAKESKSTNSSTKWFAIQQMVNKLLSENGNNVDNGKQSKIKKLKEVIDSISNNMNKEDSKVEGAKNVVEEFSALDREVIDSKTKKIQDYLSNATPSDLSVGRLGVLLKGALNHPNMVKSMLLDKVEGLDRNSIVDVLSKNSNLSKDDINGYADNFMNVVKSIGTHLDNGEGTLENLKNKVTAYLNNVGSNNYSFDFNELSKSLKSILYDPKKSLKDLKNQLTAVDIDDVKNYISNSKYVDENQMDNVVQTISNVKKSVEQKVDKIETEARQRVQILERKAIIKAEHARKTAISASWWLVITTIISAVAAIGGSLIY
ncbi:hypothetical protein [Maribacter litoralis]|uniref:Uncharacterized protein n=1 Tax=Maribacter litoralis TaxID=2059726 RepID=A0A653W7K7_9FLAO|nr:hypothetical protein [Maribacter litoralis]VXC14817.1 conserved membrane hypothetical protein [Maribacter litoralis]